MVYILKRLNERQNEGLDKTFLHYILVIFLTVFFVLFADFVALRVIRLYKGEKH